MTSPQSVLAVGLVWLSAAAAVPWRAAAGEIGGGVECQTSCGGVDIPFPFGIGPNHCMLAPGFRINCEDVGNGARKSPFIPRADVEVLSISLEQGEAKVLNPISSYCYNKKDTSQNEWRGLNLSNTPYTFSNTANKFTVVGCRALAYIGNIRGNASTMYQTGCVSMCFDRKMSLDPCSGMGCCQTAIPKGLKNYQVWFDKNLNTSGIDEGDDLGPCSFAVLMNSYSFTTSASSSNNFIDNNSSSAFNSSRGGMAPVVLDWSIGHDDCKMAVTGSDYACRSINSFCSDAASGRGYICNCNQGFKGNPYLPDGCKDIDECLDSPDKYPCYGVCTNTYGSFTCNCPTGTRGNASIAYCHKDPFSLRTTRVAGAIIGVSIGSTFLLLVLGTSFLLHKFKQRRIKLLKQKYFKQNRGQLLQQLVSQKADIAERMIIPLDELVKATSNFDKSRELGGGGHGTVYKGILSDLHVVAIKKPKIVVQNEIDEFINEVAILSQINHKNVVKLFGCCLETEVPLLVYEFVSNGTLYHHLHVDEPWSLSWITRLRIATEIATSLAYLHSAASFPIIHRDIKSSNILLDDKMTSKISDFGASRYIPIDKTGLTTRVQGTIGYLDPMYFYTGRLTDKSDVYSFGVMLVELLTRKKPFSYLSSEGEGLVAHFVSLLEVGNLVQIIDPQVTAEGGKEVEEVAALAASCVNLRGAERLTMRQVEYTLQGLQGSKNYKKYDKIAEESGRNGVLCPLPSDEGQRFQESSRVYSLEQEIVMSVPLL